MKREDFKEITEEHIKMVRGIVESNGKCENIECRDCPFYDNNSTLNVIGCTDIYATRNMSTSESDERLLESAREFLKMFESTGAIIGEGTIDKSTPIEVSEDKIKSPSHYKLEGLNCETIDVVKARLGKEGFKAFCVGNVIKYVLRAEKKNGLEDYKKVRKYLDWLIEGEEK